MFPIFIFFEIQMHFEIILSLFFAYTKKIAAIFSRCSLFSLNWISHWNHFSVLLNPIWFDATEIKTNFVNLQILDISWSYNLNYSTIFHKRIVLFLYNQLEIPHSNNENWLIYSISFDERAKLRMISGLQMNFAIRKSQVFIITVRYIYLMSKRFVFFFWCLTAKVLHVNKNITIDFNMKSIPMNELKLYEF